ACPGGRPHLQRGVQRRRGAARHPGRGARRRRARRRRQQPRRDGRHGGGRGGRARPDRRPAPALEGRARACVPGRPRPRHRARLRRDRPDGRRPLPRPGGAARAPRRHRRGCRRGHRLPVRHRRLDPALAVAPARAVQVRQRLHRLRAAHRDRRCHLRLPGLPGDHPGGSRSRHHEGHRLRDPDRDRLPDVEGGRHDRRGADRVHRPQAGDVEDVDEDHRRGDAARLLVGCARPRRQPVPHAVDPL
ncbi:MAG: hypothetical protein AVDCRST_MAG20-1468, partial [uncultured Acidimicrobiales bacterium]